MNHLGTIELSTDRLTLRRFELEDADSIFYNWAGDRETSWFCSWKLCEQADDVLPMLRGWLDRYQDRDTYIWAIEVNELEQPVGVISVKSYEEEALSMELECVVGADYQRNGVAKEAMTEVIRFLTGEVGARRIWGKCDCDDDAGCKLMLSVGMEYEGTLRKAAKYNSGIVDVTVFGLVFSEEGTKLETSEEADGEAQQTGLTRVMGEDGVLRYEISDETMEYVGILAKLELSPEEMELAKKDMADMLEYIDLLNELDTTGVEPMSHVFPVNNVFREDTVTNGDGSAATLSNAPMMKDGGFKVPKTIGE